MTVTVDAVVYYRVSNPTMVIKVMMLLMMSDDPDVVDDDPDRLVVVVTPYIAYLRIAYW